MKLKNLFILMFLFLMIAISLFFSSSPFSITQDYTCQDALIHNQSVKVCTTSERSDSMESVIKSLQDMPLSDEPYKVNTLSIIQNGTTCNYSDETKCIGEVIETPKVTGNQYIIKQSYALKTASCDTKNNITFYYTDCTSIKGNVCSASRCVNSQTQLRFYKLMERLGFRP